MSVLLLAAAAFAPLQDAAPPDPLAAVRAELDAAKDAYAAAVGAARDEVAGELKDELNDAKRRGELGTVEDLLDQRRVFLNSGIPPAAVNTRAYDRILRLELVKLERAYEAAIADAVRLDRVEDAKLLREEWERVREQPVAGRVPMAEIVVESGAAETTPLKCGAKLFTNRWYTAFDVPDTLPATQFARAAGGGKDPLKFNVRRPGRIYIAVLEQQPDQEFPGRIEDITKGGWTRTDFEFMSSGGREAGRHRLFYKSFPAGRHSLQRINFSGPILLLP